MKGICIFCGQFKELTKHHIIAQSYNGTDDAENLIPNTCRECHDVLERNINNARAKVGAGIEIDKSFQIGTTSAELLTGSVLLNDQCKGIIDPRSPIYGMRCHNQKVGERYLEATTSGDSAVIICGSPANSWIIYAIAKPPKI